jgi:hypothetical protein
VNASFADCDVLDSSFAAVSHSSSTFSMDLNGIDVRCLAATTDDAGRGSDSIRMRRFQRATERLRLLRACWALAIRVPKAAMVHELLRVGWRHA